MTQKYSLLGWEIDPASLRKLMLIGGGIALALTAFFLVTAGEPNPAWPKFWRVRPLIIVPLAGAMGGLCYYFMTQVFFKNGWRKTLAIILSLIVYIIGFWLGFVLGFDGTYWN
jgi:hypothetical protein